MVEFWRLSRRWVRRRERGERRDSVWDGRGEDEESGWGLDSDVVLGGESFWWEVDEKVFLWDVCQRSLLEKRCLV